MTRPGYIAWGDLRPGDRVIIGNWCRTVTAISTDLANPVDDTGVPVVDVILSGHIRPITFPIDFPIRKATP